MTATWTRCLMLAFRYTAVSDEKREGLSPTTKGQASEKTLNIPSRALKDVEENSGKTMTATLSGAPVTKKDDAGKEYKQVEISDITIG